MQLESIFINYFYSKCVQLLTSNYGASCLKLLELLPRSIQHFIFHFFPRLVETMKSELGEEVDVNLIYRNIWNKIKKNKNLSERFKERTTVLQVKYFNVLNFKIKFGVGKFLLPRRGHSCVIVWVCLHSYFFVK